MALVHELITSVQFIAGSIALAAVFVFAFVWDRRVKRSSPPQK
jgi:hypothetical protein